MAKTNVENSIVAQALEQAAREILMNTAARKQAGADGVAGAKEILAVKKVANKLDAIPYWVKSQNRELIRAIERSRNIARIRGVESEEGRRAIRQEAEALARLVAIAEATEASREAWR